MSFSVDLWNGFDIIKSSISLNFKRTKQILDILSSYSYILKEYYKGLDNLYKVANESKVSSKPNSLLDDSIQLIISSFKDESESIKEHYNYIYKYLNEFREKIDNIKLKVELVLTEHIQNKDIFSRILNNLILKKESYDKSCNDLSIYLAEIEAKKIIKEKSLNKEEKKKDKEMYDNNIINDKNNNIIIKNWKNNLVINLIKDIPNKKENITKKLLDNKEEYLKYLPEAENEREKYNKITEEHLNKLEKYSKNIIFFFQNSINNYLKDKKKTYKNIININEINDIDIFSKIDYEKINLDFIINNATKEFPMNHLEFIPYIINKPKIIQKLEKYTELSNEDINNIINIIKIQIKESKIDIYENEFLRQSFIGKRIAEEEKVNRLRRSGSSDMLKLKNDGKNIKALKNFNDNDNNKTIRNNNILNDINRNNINLIKNKDDLVLINLNKKRNNFRYIKDFVYRLFSSKDNNQKNILDELYSENSFDENEDEDKESENIINKERAIYNKLFFDFLELIDLSNKEHNEYLDYFIKLLSHQRSIGKFSISENEYKIILNIFSYILIHYKSSNDFIKNTILFSQTFYKTDSSSNKKIYILNGMKNNDVFNDTEIWHRAINYNLSLSIKKYNNYDFNILNKEEYIKYLNKIVPNLIISYLYDIKLSTNKEKVYEEVKNFYVQVYHLNEKLIEEQVSGLFGEINESEKDKKEK